MPVDRVDRLQQLGERAPLRPQVAAVRVDVLAEQRDLADAVGDDALAPRRRARRTAATTSRPRVDGTMQYEHFSCSRREICTQAWKSRARFAGRWPVKPSNSKKPWAVSESLVRNSASLCTCPGPNATSTNGNCAEHLLLDRLRPAAADADDALRVAPLERRRLVQVRDEALVGLLADRAGVEEDQVGVGARRRLARSRATRACPSCARSRARSSGSRTW